MVAELTTRGVSVVCGLRYPASGHGKGKSQTKGITGVNKETWKEMEIEKCTSSEVYEELWEEMTSGYDSREVRRLPNPADKAVAEEQTTNGILQAERRLPKEKTATYCGP